MIRTQISLDGDMYEEAKALAEREGISFAELVRRALRRVLPSIHSERPWMELAGVIQADAPDASESVDSVVYGREHP